MTRTVQQLFDLRGKTALVTGGVHELGWQIAHALGEAGARVMLGAYEADALEQAAADLQADGIDARWTAADCGSEAGILRLVEETLQRMGDVDILVNGALASWGALAQDHVMDGGDNRFNLNLRGYFLLSQMVAKASMIARRSGCVINVAPNAEFDGSNGIAYRAFRGAVISFTRALAAQWRPYNITVNAICPHFFPSSLNRDALTVIAHDEATKGVCVLYASDAGKHITGQWLVLDGGVGAVISA